MSIVLRYLVAETVEERFLCFIDVTKARKAEALANKIMSVLRNFNCFEKLVAQTYDGAAVMSGEKGGVQTIIRNEIPGAIFVHC